MKKLGIHWIVLIVLALFLLSPWPVLVLSHKQEVHPHLVAVASSGLTLSSPVSPVFSRAPYFILYDMKTREDRVLANRFIHDKHAVGLRIAHMLINEKVGVVIGRYIGPEPFSNLNIRNVLVFEGTAGTVEQNIGMFSQNRLAKISRPTVKTHYGLKSQGQAVAPVTEPCPFNSAPAAPAQRHPVASGLSPAFAPAVPGLTVMRNQAPFYSSNVGLPDVRLVAAQRDKKVIVQVPELGMEIYPSNYGSVVIARVYSGSSAARAQLLPNDQIVKLDGQAINSMTAFLEKLNQASPGLRTQFTIVRNGATQLMNAVIGEGEMETATVPANAATPYGQAGTMAAPSTPPF